MPESPVLESPVALPESPVRVPESSAPEVAAFSWHPRSFRQPAVESPSIVESETITLPSPKASKKGKINKKARNRVAPEVEEISSSVNVIESSRPSLSQHWEFSEV